MIEMLGVLAIVGVLSVGGIAGYSKAMTKFKINKTADQVSTIVANIRTLYAQQTTYDGLNSATAIQMGVTPDEMGSGTTLTNPFNGDVSIRAHWSGIKKFTIVYNGLPKEACITLATHDWGSKHSSGLLAISAAGGWGASGPMNVADDIGYEYALECTNDGSVFFACPGDANNPTPMSVSRAAQACACEANSCSVGWKFQ